MVTLSEIALPGLAQDVQPVRAFTSFSEILRRFEGQRVVTVATGSTCAYLGDERNLREFLVADEAVRRLREAGHLVHFLLFDDNLDPLNARQLRVAVNKDPEMIAKWLPECGKPISEIADPYGCHGSFAEHFEAGVMARLSRLGAHPTLIGTSRLYAQGAYRPFVETVLLQHDEILRFLRSTFPNYNPTKLFQPICPDCGYIDSTEVRAAGPETLFFCSRCEKHFEEPASTIRGKLGWKLDHAAKWAMYGVDTEPFSLAYLEPREGSFVVARALGSEFFGARPVMPIRYGLVTMPKELGGKLLSSLPPTALRSLMVDRWKSELDITAERVRLEASRHQIAPGVTFTDAIKQLVPTWLLKPESLTPAEREIVAAGTSFSEHFGTLPMEFRFPTREAMAAERPDVLAKAATFLGDVQRLRAQAKDEYDAFDPGAKALVEGLGDASKEVVACVRRLVGQEKGIPTRRLLFHLPMDYIGLVSYVAEMAARESAPTHAVVQMPAHHAPRGLKLEIAR